MLDSHQLFPPKGCCPGGDLSGIELVPGCGKGAVSTKVCSLPGTATSSGYWLIKPLLDYHRGHEKELPSHTCSQQASQKLSQNPKPGMLINVSTSDPDGAGWRSMATLDYTRDPVSSTAAAQEINKQCQ